MRRHRLPEQRSQHTMSAARSVLSRVRAYLRYRDTITQLSRLSDRDLADLGINRSEIRGIARV
ncbi:hypothetical protein GCM10007890_62970 [Methylobacterium tardum]|uniref:YjiS-like domain-containing protein n=1 Tax=Methylobacterium tardum TaxID=374432 RepID=A0AA37TR84_9HYPH|nr:hypothetical protein GCM10007890_62970 [Methylobacterium tardum]